MTDSADRLHRWIYLLTAGLLYTAVALRAGLDLAGDPFLAEGLLLLLAWLVLFVIETWIHARWGSTARWSPSDPAPKAPQAPPKLRTSGRSRPSSWGPFFPLYLAAQSAIVVDLLARAEFGDYYCVLFGILSMQAMLRLGWKTAVIWVALFIPLTGLPLTLTYDVPQAVAFACMYAAANGFLAFFAFVTRRAVEARKRNQALVDELQEGNREIRAYSRQIERLAATKERHRLARELHDSVTQTVFSMNLTAQSAALLLPRDRSAASTQLGRLEELAQSALAEIGLLGSELTPVELGEGGLALALRQHLAQRGLLGDDGATVETGPPRGLRVALSVECTEEPGGGAGGGGCAATAAHAQSALSPAEELCLFRIAQEALNNIVKHAQTGDAAIRLRLSPPCWLVIEDRGRGFIPEAAEGAWPADSAQRAGGAQPPDDARSAAGSPPEQGSGGMGLANMRERAAEIGWRLSIVSVPGQGTRITAEQSEKRAEG